MTKTKKTNVLEIEESIRPFHPLFRPKEGDSLEDFSPPTDFETYYITIGRTGGPNGPEEAGREFTFAEIPNRETLVAMFGGGRYELEARTAKGQFYARRWLNIAEPAKPFVMQPDAPQAQPQQAAGDLGALAGLAGAPGGGNLFAMANGSPMALLLLMMMQDKQAAEARADRQATIQAQSSVEMFKALAMMMGGRSGTDPAIATVFASMTDLVKSERLAAAQASQPQQLVPPRTFEEEIERAAKMVSMLRKLDPKAKEESLGDIIKEIAPYLQPFIPQILGAGGMANGAIGEGVAETAVDVAAGSVG